MRTVADWEARLTDFDVTFGPILTIPEVLKHPLVAQRGLLAPVTYGNAAGKSGILRAVSPVRYSGFGQELRRNPPVLGEDTDTVLGDIFGLGTAEIEQLHRQGVVSSPGQDSAHAGEVSGGGAGEPPRGGSTGTVKRGDRACEDRYGTAAPESGTRASRPVTRRAAPTIAAAFAMDQGGVNTFPT